MLKRFRQISTDILKIVIILAMFYNTIYCLNLQIIYPTLNYQSRIIYDNNQLQNNYNDSEFNKLLSCKNGKLEIVQFNQSWGDQQLKFYYHFNDQLIPEIRIQTLFQQSSRPIPVLVQLNQSYFALQSNCKRNQTNKDNYYNKVTLFLDFKNDTNSTYQFSLLMGCDKGGRNKQFEFGYIIIALINAAITIGVALYSKIWSIRYKGKPLSIELSWFWFVIILGIVIISSIVFFLQVRSQQDLADNFLYIIGLILAYIFCFICADEIFFLVRKFKKQIFKFIRICDVLSFLVASAITVIAIFFYNWIYYDILAMGICVGGIKLFRFKNMKHGYVSMFAITLFVAIGSGVLHFLLERSYNDYASDLSSPLFIQVPDLIQNLYKKCSWLPIIDVIIPGVLLSYLRRYDQNYNTGWGGVYTVVGNLSFIISTILWIIVQKIYPYGVPFCLVTYSSLCLSIFITAKKRNEFNTLWQGLFYGANNQSTTNLIPSGKTQRQSFGNMITEEIIDSIKINLNDDNSEEKQKQKDKDKDKDKINHSLEPSS